MIFFLKKTLCVFTILLALFGWARTSYAVESLVTFSTHFNAVVAGTTYYLIPGQNGWDNTTESIAYFIAPTDGTLQNLYFESGQPGGSNTITGYRTHCSTHRNYQYQIKQYHYGGSNCRAENVA